MKILLLRFSSIGDIVLTTPLLRCLHQQLPDAQIHYLTRTSYVSLLAPNPHIHKLWHFKNDIHEVIRELRKENFDFIADLHCNWRSYRLRLALKRPSAGFPKLNFKKWVLVNTKINLMPDAHVVNRYFKAVRRLGIVNDLQGAEIFIPYTEQLNPDSLPAEFQEGFIAMAIGARHYTKQIPESLAITLIRQLPLPVILLGGPEDQSKAESIAQQNERRAYNACGKFSLMQSASALSLAKLVITADTGLMHMAAALHKKIIVIWGNTVPEFGMGPYFPSSTQTIYHSEVKGLSCRPCSKLGHERCPRTHFRCMMDQQADLILQKAMEMLKE